MVALEPLIQFTKRVTTGCDRWETYNLPRETRCHQSWLAIDVSADEFISHESSLYTEKEEETKTFLRATQMETGLGYT
jgi:hypothetical protein